MSSVPGDSRVVDCPVCDAQTPAGNFCGVCGAALGAALGRRRWLRPRTFGAAPGERLALPALASSLFPHLPGRSRLPLRIGLALVAAGLLGFAALRLPVMVISLAAVGVPLLFVVYLRSSRVDRDLPRHAAALAAVLGAALGVSWAVMAGRLTGHAYGLPMTESARAHIAVGGGVVGAAIGAVLMSAPALAVRLGPSAQARAVRREQTARREALDGFALGALGALAFTAAATLTRFAPQFDDGVVAAVRPRANLAVQAGVCGVAIPVTAAAAGGIVGIALWFAPRRGHARARTVLWALAAAVVGVYVAAGVADDADIPQLVMLTLHLALAVVALLLLRTALQIALLHEVPDPVSGEPLLCEHCEHVVPDAAFCPACGVATRASSRASRRFRRSNRPVPVAAEDRP